MAFAQFYYDPALEFERMLDDDGAPAEPPAALIGGGGRPSSIAAGSPQGSDGAAAAASKSTGSGAIVRSASMSASETRMPPQELQGRRWIGEGLLKRCASTGSVNGGLHPGIPK
ncbi:hypothetical protein BC628DRAFT_1361342 [Trametes gibbosa]|nr:hypothetical protein BC628DRAFT_1361342 [Trametes gibbosa]